MYVLENNMYSNNAALFFYQPNNLKTISRANNKIILNNVRQHD